jgi:hypothetical protein
MSCWLVIQDLYPDREVDAELPDEDNNGQKEPASDDAGGEGAPSVETLAPNPIGSSLAGEPHPLTAQSHYHHRSIRRWTKEETCCARD